MGNDLISVIIPVYNAESYVEKCVNSVANQTYRNLEIIIVDDGSVDESVKICKSLQAKDGRIKLFCKENGGVSSARNVGLQHCNGSFFAFVDADDYIGEDFVSKTYDIACGKSCDIVFTRWTRVFPDGNEQKTYEARLDELKGKDVSSLFFMDGGFANKTMGSSCRTLFRRSSVEGLRFNENLALGEDLDFLVRALARAEKIETLDEYCYYYSFNPVSATHVMNNSLLLNKLTNSYRANLQNVKDLGREDLIGLVNYGYVLRYVMNIVNNGNFLAEIKRSLKENDSLNGTINKNTYKDIKKYDISLRGKVRNYFIFHRKWRLLRLFNRCKR